MSTPLGTLPFHKFRIWYFGLFTMPASGWGKAAAALLVAVPLFAICFYPEASSTRDDSAKWQSFFENDNGVMYIDTDSIEKSRYGVVKFLHVINFKNPLKAKSMILTKWLDCSTMRMRTSDARMMSGEFGEGEVVELITLSSIGRAEGKYYESPKHVWEHAEHRMVCK